MPGNLCADLDQCFRTAQVWHQGWSRCTAHGTRHRWGHVAGLCEGCTAVILCAPFGVLLQHVLDIPSLSLFVTMMRSRRLWRWISWLCGWSCYTEGWFPRVIIVQLFLLRRFKMVRISFVIIVFTTSAGGAAAANTSWWRLSLALCLVRRLWIIQFFWRFTLLF